MKRQFTIIAFAAAAALACVKSTMAAEFASEYSISVIGLNVGTSRFKTTINDNRYEITGSMRAELPANCLDVPR